MNTKEHIQRPIKTLFFILMACAIIFSLYMTIYRDIDREMCTNRIAQKLRIEPSYASIIEYIKTILLAGITRDDVYKQLQAIAPLQIEPIDNYAGLLDKVTIKICNHPLNNLRFYAYYTFGGQLLEIRFDEEP